MTSHVEGFNNVIKRELKTNNTLCDLISVLDTQLENEMQ